MELSIAIFIIGILLSIIAWFFQKMLNEILDEIKSLRHDFEKSTVENIKTKAIVQNLPCRINGKHCYTAQGNK